MNNTLNQSTHSFDVSAAAMMKHRFADWVRKSRKSAKLARRVKAERRALAHLSDRDLLDIGVTRAEVGIEAKRAYWDIPHHRLGR